MGFDFILLVLVLFKSYQHYRPMPGESWRGARLMNVIARDSGIYFFWYVNEGVHETILLISASSFSTFLVNALLWNLVPLDLFQLATCYTAMIGPAVGARLILNIRKASREGLQGPGTTSEWGPTSGPIETLELRVRPYATDAHEDMESRTLWSNGNI